MSMPAPTVKALRHLPDTIEGGSGAQIFSASDGNEYVVKFLQNNQGSSLVLINDMVASRLAKFLGAPVPDVAIVEIDASLITSTILGDVPNAQPGFHFGSRRVPGAYKGNIRTLVPMASNREDFPLIVLADQWCLNGDRDSDENLLFAGSKIYAIDFGHCFGMPIWDEQITNRIRSWVKMMPEIVNCIGGSDPFNQGLVLLKDIPAPMIRQVTEEIPDGWWPKSALVDVLASFLDERRIHLPQVLIGKRSEFSKWTAT
jgi:hypothetical protein